MVTFEAGPVECLQLVLQSLWSNRGLAASGRMALAVRMALWRRWLAPLVFGRLDDGVWVTVPGVVGQWASRYPGEHGERYVVA